MSLLKPVAPLQGETAVMRAIPALARGVVLVCCSVASLVFAEAAWQPGDALPARLALKDQHEKALPLERETRLIFLAAEMGGSKVMAKALEALPPTALRERKAIYIADITSMPEPIATIVAVPRLQKLPYPVALVRHADQTMRLPRKAGAVTVLHVADGRIAAVEYAHTPEQVSRYLR